MKSKKHLGNLLLLLTAMIWGTAFVAQRAGMDDIGPLTFNAARMALAAGAVGGLALFWRRPGAAEADPRSTLLGGLGCGLFLSAASIAQQMGLVTTTAGKAGFITAMYLLLVPVLRLLLFRRRSPALVWLAVGLGVAGLYLLTVTGDLRLTRGDSLVALCALFFSGHILCCDHFVQKGDPLGMSALQFLTATLISGAAALLTEEPSLPALRAAALPILYCGLVSGGVGYTLQIVAQRFTDPTVASLLMSMESVFAVLAGALLLRERMTGRETLGCAVLLAAILLVQLPQRPSVPPDGPSARP